MAAHLLSLNVGRPEPSTAKNVGVTGIDKQAVDSAHLRAPGPKHGGLGSGVDGRLHRRHQAPRRRLPGGLRRSRARSSTGGRPSWGASSRTACSGRTSPPPASTSTARCRRALGGRRRGRPRGLRPADPVRDVRGPDGGARLGQAVLRGRSDRRLPVRRDGRHGPPRRRDRGGVPAGPRHHGAGHVPGVHGRPRGRRTRPGRRLPGRGRGRRAARDGRPPPLACRRARR